MTNRTIRHAWLFLVFCPVGLSWSGDLEHLSLEHYMRWGPVRARPGLEFTDFGYDSNIYLSDDASAVGDYTAAIAPKLDGLFLTGSRSFLTFQAKVRRFVYLQNSDLDYTDYVGSARYTVPFERSGVYVEYDYSDILARPIDQEDQRTQVKSNTVGFGLILQPAWKTEIELKPSSRDLAYRDPDDPTIARRLNRSEDAAEIHVKYAIRGRTKLRFGGLGKAIVFDDAIELPGQEPIARDSRETRLTVGAEFGEGGRLTGLFDVGWGTIDAEDPVLPDFRDVVGQAMLALRVGDRSRIRLNARRIPGFSVYRTSVYYLDSHYGLRFIHYLTRLVGVEAGGSRGTLTFPGSADVTDREDKLRRYDAGVRLRLYRNSIGRRVEYSFRLGRYRRTSTDETLNRSQWTLGMNAVLGF